MLDLPSLCWTRTSPLIIPNNSAISFVVENIQSSAILVRFMRHIYCWLLSFKKKGVLFTFLRLRKTQLLLIYYSAWGLFQNVRWNILILISFNWAWAARSGNWSAGSFIWREWVHNTLIISYKHACHNSVFMRCF